MLFDSASWRLGQSVRGSRYLRVPISHAAPCWRFILVVLTFALTGELTLAMALALTLVLALLPALAMALVLTLAMAAAMALAMVAAITLALVEVTPRWGCFRCYSELHSACEKAPDVIPFGAEETVPETVTGAAATGTARLLELGNEDLVPLRAAQARRGALCLRVRCPTSYLRGASRCHWRRVHQRMDGTTEPGHLQSMHR